MSERVRNEMRYGDHRMIVWTREDGVFTVEALSWVAYLVAPDGQPVLACDKKMALHLARMLAETAEGMEEDER